MNILLAGGAGYIGSHTAVELLTAGHDVVIVDNYCNSCAEAVNRVEEVSGKKVVSYEADVKDKVAMAKIFAENKIDCVIHFAGLKAVGESVQKPIEYYRNNIDTTLTLLECMKEAGVKKFVFSSSATVYGEENDIHGSIYQIYNQRTLGMSEDELMTSLNKITHQVVEQEMHLRSTEIKKNRDAYEDSIYKAYGILKYARSLTLKEAMDYLSNIRIGLCEHMIELDADKDFDIYRLMMASGSAMLDYKAGTVLSAAQRNHQRAGLIRASLPDLK